MDMRSRTTRLHPAQSPTRILARSSSPTVFVAGGCPSGRCHRPFQTVDDENHAAIMRTNIILGDSKMFQGLNAVL
ncbi:MAG: hypothetical protein M5U34_00005, partial [Chloroflexi bacterium]|nr:hypothetical protein [Chloroflexota bacterium]